MTFGCNSYPASARKESGKMATQKQVEALKLLLAAEGKSVVKDGPRPNSRERRSAQFALAESIASGEFPTQIVPAVRSIVQSRHSQVERTSDRFTTRKTVTAINVPEEIRVYSVEDQKNIQDNNGGNPFVAGGLPTVLPRQPYQQIGLQASDKKISARKMGEAFGLDWESVVAMRGSNVDVIREAFQSFGDHAGNQEEIDVFGLLVNSAGFRTGAGTALNQGLSLTGNPDLTDPVAMAAAIGELLERDNVAGGVTAPESYSKFVALTTVGNAPLLRQGIGARRVVRNPGATTGYSWEETVEFGAEVEVIGSAWMKKLFPGAGKHVILVPVAEGSNLPVLTSNFLEGYETPSVWIKDSNARQVGGGEVNSLVDGDFDSDSIVTKVRHVHGADALWAAQIGYTTGANA